MVADDHQASAGLQHLGGLHQQLAQRIQLAVHLDAQRLEEHGQVFVLHASRQMAAHGLAQVCGGRYLTLAAGLDDGLGHLASVGQLAVEAQDARQLLVVGVVHQVARRSGAATVHAQVQLALEAGRETALGHIELVAAHPHVGQQAVDAAHTVQPQIALQVAEVLADERKPTLTLRAPLSTLHSRRRILVLVEGNQMALRPQPLHDGTRMAAATEGDVDIHAVGTDIQSIHRLGEHHGSMVFT